MEYLFDIFVIKLKLLILFLLDAVWLMYGWYNDAPNEYMMKQH